MAYLVHQIPGRIRIKVPTIRYTPGGASVVQSLLERLSGVEKVQCNPVTGSVIVYYDQSRLTVEEIVEALKEAGHLNAVASDRSHSTPEPFMPSKASQFVAKALLNVALDVALKNTPFSFLAAFI